MVVYAPPGSIVGYIKQLWDCFRPRFDILDANQQSVMTVEGPVCTCQLCGDVDFEVTYVGLVHEVETVAVEDV